MGQGIGNLVAGVFQGMPVGGSASASALAVAAGARTRLAPIVAALVIALTVLLLGGAVELIAMPALAALLIVVGAGTVRPGRVIAEARLGSVQLVVVTVTLVLTLLVPLQYAVLVGVGLSLICTRSGNRARSSWSSSTWMNMAGCGSRRPRPFSRRTRWSSCSPTEACSSPQRRRSSDNCPSSPKPPAKAWSSCGFVGSTRSA